MAKRIKKLKLEPAIKTYKGNYKLAVVDALNVLGAATRCVECCEGCQYERNEAMDVLYGALGLRLDFKKPMKSYKKFSKIRDKTWKV